MKKYNAAWIVIDNDGLGKIVETYCEIVTHDALIHFIMAKREDYFNIVHTIDDENGMFHFSYNDDGKLYVCHGTEIM